MKNQNTIFGNVLYLNLKKKWFDMIAKGEKTEEYREIKEYWLKRLFLYDGSVPFDKPMLDEIITELKKKPYSFDDLYYWADWKPKPFNFICFKNGYSKNAPEIWCGYETIEIKPAKPEWSENAKGNYFVLRLGEILAAPVCLTNKELANCIYYEEGHIYYCFQCVEKRMEEINTNKEFSEDIDFEGGDKCGYFQDYANEDYEVECCKCGKPLFSTGVDS